MPRPKKDASLPAPEHIARIVQAGGAITPEEQAALAGHVLGDAAPVKRRRRRKNKTRKAKAGKKKISKSLEKKMVAQLKKDTKAGRIKPKRTAANVAAGIV